MERLTCFRFDESMNNVIDNLPDMTSDNRLLLPSSVRNLTVAVAIGAAAAGGVFVAFSTFVMKALKQLPDNQGIAAMQSINRAAPSPVFMGLLFGTAIAGVGLGVRALRHGEEPASKYVVIGAGLYLVGIVLTAAYHVPHNDALARLDPTSAGSVARWHDYVSHWTAWNHVRALTSLASAAAFTLAIVAD